MIENLIKRRVKFNIFPLKNTHALEHALKIGEVFLRKEHLDESIY